ncbi:hypothetical protein FXO21_25845 [Dyadobacter sp. UC 10]|nr:hypothetical protein FXO21_25845 [Dyadobacter sp. UC 10]
MRDKRFVAVHRGGILTKEHHRHLMWWARECCQHVLPLMKSPIDDRLIHALQVAQNWEEGIVGTGVAMKASLGAHAVARELSDPTSIAIARAIGQTVATAHMADHSLGGAIYGLLAVQRAGRSVADERDWQGQRLQRLPPDLMELVKSTMFQKINSLKSFATLLD